MGKAFNTNVHISTVGLKAIQKEKPKNNSCTSRKPIQQFRGAQIVRSIEFNTNIGAWLIYSYIKQGSLVNKILMNTVSDEIFMANISAYLIPRDAHLKARHEHAKYEAA